MPANWPSRADSAASASGRSTPPAAPAVTLASGAISNSTTVQLTVASCADRTHVLTVAAVNGSRYGLASAVFTRDLSSAMAFADGVETGQVSINLPTSGWDVHMPFGGYKASGIGRQNGIEGFEQYLETKTIGYL